MATDRPAEDRHPSGGARLSLAARIFLITGLLILLAVALAVAVTAWLGFRIAEDDAAAELERTSALQRAFGDERYQRLWLIADLFSLDPYLSAYIAEAAQSADSASILDLLEQNQRELGFDLAVVLTPQGRVLAHTARPDAVGEDLSGRPLVAAALAEFGASGVYRDGGRLFDAVVVPASRGGDLNGFLIIGDRIDDGLAARILDVSRAQVAYFDASEGRLDPVGSTLGPERVAALADRLAEAAGGADRVFSEAGRGGDAASREWRIELDGERWLARPTPFRDAAGKIIGGSVTLSSLAEQLATFRELQWLLTAAGAASILLALGLSYPLARRALRPVRSLLRAAEAARRGEYDQRVATGGGDEVARLASAFDDLLSDLRQKRDMEAYMGHLAVAVPEEEPSPGEAEEAVEGTLVAVELHRHAASAEAPAVIMESLRRDVAEIGRLAASAGGRIETVAGHRVLLGFEGDGAPQRALVTTANLLGALGRQGPDDGVRPSVAIVRGRIVRGTVGWSGGSGATILGLPVRRADALLREAAPGEVLLSEDVVEGVAEALESMGLKLRPQASLLDHRKLYALDPEQVDRLAGDHWPGETVAIPDRPETGKPLPRIAVGTLLGGRFEIVSELGSGGVGVVFRARDRQLGDTVALKVLRETFWHDATFLARLKEELKLARRVTHPNVLRTYDFGELDGVPFVSMEHVRGVTLRFLLDRASERLPFTACLSVSRQLCAGLGAAHALGVIHRDVKPENVILDAAGNAKLMDFGLARPAAQSGDGLTREGRVVGTPQYMAPERFGEGEVDARTDVYSCGIILYEMFTAARPYRGGTVVETISQHLHEAPVPPRQQWPEMPERLEAIILRCLEKELRERYPDAAALLRELERVQV